MVDIAPAQHPDTDVDANSSDKKTGNDPIEATILDTNGDEDDHYYRVQRGLRPRHIQLIAISGAIGAGLFISIGGPLTVAGPLGLLIGIAIWGSIVWVSFTFYLQLIIQSSVFGLNEIVTLLPIPGGFIYHAGRFFDPAVRFALGCISLVCFELTAMTLTAQYWNINLHPAVCVSLGLAGLALANGVNVRAYGEIEFWVSILKIILLLILFSFTIVTMAGGNPKHDAYGFRYWQNPGLFVATTAFGRLRGIWRSVQWSAFSIVGPEFISILSGETHHPRKVLPRAFSTIIFRIVFFFLLGSIFASVNAPYNDPALLGAIAAGAPGAAKSPYIINMDRLGIPVLPHIVNTIVITSVFSTASSYLYGASRCLYTLGRQGQAPRIFSKTNRYGTPWVAVLALCLCSTLAFLSVNKNSAIVLDWFINLTAACQLLNWLFIGILIIRFRAGLKFHGLTEGFLPEGVKSRFSVFGGWYCAVGAFVTLLFSGYGIMAPGAFDAPDLIFTYGAVFIFVALWIGWKIHATVQRTGETWMPIRVQDMDFNTGVDEMNQLAARDEEEVEKPKSVLAKIDRVLFH